MDSLNCLNLKIASAYPDSEIGYLRGSTRESVPTFLRQGYRLFTGREVLEEKASVIEDQEDSIDRSLRHQLFLGDGSIVSSHILFVHPSGNVKVSKSISTDMIPEKREYFDVNFDSYGKGNFIPVTEAEYHSARGREFTDAERRRFSAIGIRDAVKIGQKIPIYDNAFWLEIAGNDETFLRDIDGMVRTSEQRENSHHGSVYLQQPDANEIRGYFVQLGQVFEGIILDTGVSRNLDSESSAHPIKHFGIKPQPSAEIVQLKKREPQADMPLELRLVA